MRFVFLFGAAAIALAIGLPPASVSAQEAKRYPTWSGLWKRGSPPGVWDPSKPAGLGQQPPLTPEYRAIHEANIAKAKVGIDFDPKSTCGPVGMPRVMTMYEPMELVIQPHLTHMLIESIQFRFGASSRTGATGRRKSIQLMRATRLATGSIPIMTAPTTRWKSKPVTSRDRACSTIQASRCTRTTRRS